MTPTSPVAPGIALYTDAHKHASRHRAELDSSGICGCFFCFRTFTAKDIKAWIDSDQTALCPRCGIDSVIGSASGHAIEDRFLRKMHQHYFSYRSK